MLQALLHGKLSRQQENMEDVLTSNVFGLLRYLAPQDGLFPLLARSEARDPITDDDRWPLRFLGEVSRDMDVCVEYDFWPYGRSRLWTLCEPDVVIRVTIPPSEKLMFLIEAKYRSGKSSVAKSGSDTDSELESDFDNTPSDQLAREWDNLVGVAGAEGYTPKLIYVTAHMATPNEAISESVDDYDNSAHVYETTEPRIYSLLWRQVYEVVANRAAILSERETCVLNDLGSLMRRTNLTYFHGIGDLSNAQNIKWRFSR